MRKFSLAHLTAQQCAPPELVDIAAGAGFDFVSLRMTAVTAGERLYPLMSDREMMRETKRRLRATGLAVLDVELARLGPAEEPESYTALLEASAELGARAVIAQLPDSDRQRATDRYGRLCDLARGYNLAVVLEFVSWTETPDLPSATAVISAADRVNGGLLVDTLHFHRSGSALSDLRRVPREWFHFVHLCDAPERIPASVEEAIHTARQQRLFPGEGGLPIGEILECLPNVPCSLEIPNSQLISRLGPEEYARRALERTKRYFSEESEKKLSIRRNT